MNQEKIGKFIATIRKEKNMTQQELADSLNITDRAISKWENGRGMPDLSLIKPLCDKLDISVNELLSGERLERKEYQEKLEENIINTINYTNKKIKNNKRNLKFLLLIIFLFVGTIISLFFVDVHRMSNNEKVFFSTWGFGYIPPIDLHEEEIKLTIENYIINRNENDGYRYDSEKWFVSFETYLIEEKEENKLYNVYAWVLEESYYLDNNQIKENSGSSIPHKFVVEKIDDKYIVVDSLIPRDGSLYIKDMKKLFPNKVRKAMDKVHVDGTIEKLELDIQKQVTLYFHN